MVLEKGLGRQPLSIHSEHQKSTTIFSRSVGEDEGDFLKPLLIKSKVNKKNAFKKNEVGKTKKPQNFSQESSQASAKNKSLPLHQQRASAGRQKKTASQTI